MTKATRRTVSFILATLVLFGASFVSVNAAVSDESEISPCYENITNRTASLVISGINAECTARLVADSTLKLTIKMELQKDTSDGYETVKTWTETKTGKTLTMSESRLINILYDYRLKVTFTAGSETVVVYKYV